MENPRQLKYVINRINPTHSPEFSVVLFLVALDRRCRKKAALIFNTVLYVALSK
jgi:hypothetical protein